MPDHAIRYPRTESGCHWVIAAMERFNRDMETIETTAAEDIERLNRKIERALENLDGDRRTGTRPRGGITRCASTRCGVAGAAGAGGRGAAGAAGRRRGGAGTSGGAGRRGGGKRDEDDRPDRNALIFEQDWIDDEETGRGVLD